MKIAIPKPAPAPSAVERPQLSTPKSGNTGIVPPAQTKPTDSFQPAKPTGTGGTPTSTGTAATTPNKPTSTSTYALAPALEPHRATFDRVGQRIAKLPSHIQEAAIVRATDRLSKKFAGIATLDQVSKGVREAVAYAGRSTTTEDPQAYVMRTAEEAVGTARGVGSQLGQLPDYGRQITRDPSSLNAGNILRNVRQPQPEPQPDESRQLFRRMPRWF